MPAFEYTVLLPNGKKKKGSEEADSARQLRQRLRDKHYVIMKVDQTKTKSAIGGKQFSLFAPKLSVREISLITRQLATMIQAALPIEQALGAVADQSSIPKIKSVMTAIRSRVMEGYTLADSLSEYPSIFSELFRSTVAAGEKSGNLTAVLEQLADYTESSQQSRQKIQLALMYPLILTISSFAIVSFLLGYVVPDVVKVFVDSDQDLPTMTKIIIGLSDFIKASWFYVFILLIAASIGFKYGLQKPKFKMAWHNILLKTPLIGGLFRSMDIVRYTNTLSILVHSGVPLVDALKIASSVVSNTALKGRLSSTAQSVSEGSSLKNAMEDTRVFPPMLLHMVGSGEVSGELDKMLERCANNQDQELKGFVAMLVGLFEPVILLFMGGIVLMIVLAIMLPILNMNELVQ